MRVSSSLYYLPTIYICFTLNLFSIYCGFESIGALVSLAGVLRPKRNFLNVNIYAYGSAHDRLACLFDLNSG